MSLTQPPFRTEADARPPRPGWVKTLGVAHLVVGIFMSIGMLSTLAWVLMLASAKTTDGNSPGMMGMDAPQFVWFVVIDALTGLAGNGLTFASGLGLINLKVWGARIWRWLAPAKITRLLIIWVGFIAVVAPVLASGMGRSVVKMFEQQNMGRAKIPSAAEVSLIYAWAFLAMGIGMIVLGSIYPAVTWYVVNRPGFKAALVETNPPLPGEVQPS